MNTSPKRGRPSANLQKVLNDSESIAINLSGLIGNLQQINTSANKQESNSYVNENGEKIKLNRNPQVKKGIKE